MPTATDSHDNDHEQLRNDVSMLMQFMDEFDAKIQTRLDALKVEQLEQTVQELQKKLEDTRKELNKELSIKATKDELSIAAAATKQAAAAAETAREGAQNAQTTANDGVKRANSAQNTANQALSRRLHMKTESVVYRSDATFDVQFTEGSRILGVWWSSQDESHVLAQFSIGDPQINGQDASVKVTGKGPGHKTAILWCILYEG